MPVEIKSAPKAAEESDDLSRDLGLFPKPAPVVQDAPLRRDTLSPMQDRVHSEKPEGDRASREEQLRQYAPLTLNSLYNRMFDSEEASRMTQKAKIKAITDKEFGAPRARGRTIRRPEDNIEIGGESAI